MKDVLKQLARCHYQERAAAYEKNEVREAYFNGATTNLINAIFTLTNSRPSVTVHNNCVIVFHGDKEFTFKISELYI